jgi:hypothetical protein
LRESRTLVSEAIEVAEGSSAVGCPFCGKKNIINYRDSAGFIKAVGACEHLALGIDEEDGTPNDVVWEFRCGGSMLFQFENSVPYFKGDGFNYWKDRGIRYIQLTGISHHGGHEFYSVIRFGVTERGQIHAPGGEKIEVILDQPAIEIDAVRHKKTVTFRYGETEFYFPSCVWEEISQELDLVTGKIWDDFWPALVTPKARCPLCGMIANRSDHPADDQIDRSKACPHLVEWTHTKGEFDARYGDYRTISPLFSEDGEKGEGFDLLNRTFIDEEGNRFQFTIDAYRDDIESEG